MCNLHDDIDSQLQGITGSNSSFLLGHIYMIMWSNGNTLSIAGPVWGESSSHQRFPSQRASDVDLLSFLLLGRTTYWKTMELPVIWDTIPDSTVHGANMGPTWVLSAPDGPHVGPMNLVIRDDAHVISLQCYVQFNLAFSESYSVTLMNHPPIC